MGSDIKIIIGILAFSIIVIVGSILLLSRPSDQKATLQKIPGARIQLLEDSFNFGDIGYSGGLVSHSFKVKNIGDKDLEVANLATSCMCTEVYFKGPLGEGPKMSMKGMSKPSSWKGVLKQNEEGEVVAVFDPAFHGPQGVGPVSRTISFETNDADKPYVEFLFNALVVK